MTSAGASRVDGVQWYRREGGPAGVLWGGASEAGVMQKAVGSVASGHTFLLGGWREVSAFQDRNAAAQSGSGCGGMRCYEGAVVRSRRYIPKTGCIGPPGSTARSGAALAKQWLLWPEYAD